jgi:hypothetical protein
MPTHTAITANEHINVIRGASPTYMKGVSDLCQRGHALWATLKEHGVIEYNAEDHARVWQVQVREPDVRVSQDTTQKVFENHDAYETVQVDIRGYEASDVLTRLQYKKTRGQRNQLINHYNMKMSNIAKAIMRRMNEWLYRDGNVAPYTDGFLGFESCLADDGGTLVGEKIAVPSDSYAGLSTAPGALGGAWSEDLDSGERPNAGLANDWPFGQGSSEYDAWSPTLWNWGSSRWTTAGDWEANAEEVLREAVAVVKSRNGYANVTGAPMFHIMSPDMYVGAKNFYSTRMQIYVPYTIGDVGFPQETLNLDGTVLMCDYGCPAGTGYGICPGHLEAFFLGTDQTHPDGDMIIDVDGPTWSTEYQAYLYYAAVDGNLRMQPKFMAKYKNYKDS